MSELQQRVFAALEKPGAYPHDARRPVRFKETHVSRVFLTGKFAYKVKKEMQWSMVDYSTIEKRRAFCEKELALNKPLCREMYLAVVPIVIDAKDNVAVLDEKQAKKQEKNPGAFGETVEYALKMLEFPQETMLSAKLRRGDNDAGAALFKGIASRLAAFHYSQPTGGEINASAAPEKITARWNDDFRVAGQNRRLNQQFVSRVHHFIETHRGLLEQRIREGRARDCHGDAHTGNVFVPKRGKFFLFDRIEFDDSLRWGDCARDAAFMAMDLDFLKRPDLREVFAAEYARRARDKTVGEILPFYQAYYAFVRGFVNDLRAAQEKDRDAALKAKKAANAYFRLAESCEF
ncbi:MAG: hypothetical protein NTY90_00440 [Candidatus Micrarchaeota archaeon]|nr:hypothetical protein [Candidatus Micrarchaeota archaeon]